MFRIYHLVLVFIALCGLSLGCGGGRLALSHDNQGKESDVIVKGDQGLRITAPILYDQFRRQRMLPNGGLLTADEVSVLLDTLLLDTLTGLQAAEVNIEDHYLDFWEYRLRYRDFLTTAYVNERVVYPIKPDSAAVIAFYNERKDIFSVPEQVELYHILISPKSLLGGPDSLVYTVLDSAGLATAVKAHAFDIYDKLQAGMDFTEAAEQYSHDQLTAKIGGHIGWTKRGTYLNPFDSVAFSMKPGDISAPYNDRDGWHILYISDYISEGPPSLDRDGMFDTVRETLIQIDANLGTMQLFDSLYQHIDITFNEEWIDTNAYKMDDSIWAAVVNGQDTIDFRYIKTSEQTFRRRATSYDSDGELNRAVLRLIAERMKIVQAAREEGVDTLYYIKKESDRLRHLTAKSILESRRFDPTWRPSDSAIEAYYNEHIGDYVAQKPFKLKEIVVNDSVLAVYLYDLASSGYDFDELVREYVPAEGGFEARLVDLGFVNEDEIPPAIVIAAKKTEPGFASTPVAHEGEYHIVKVQERKDPQRFIQVKGNISSILTAEYRHRQISDTLEHLKRKYNVTFPSAIPSIYLKPIRERARDIEQEG